MSHPVWVRGLKLFVAKGIPIGTASHPVWVRGLKHFKSTLIPSISIIVAPRVGAWIETLRGEGRLTYSQSHPVWVRGLKLLDLKRTGNYPGRTPCGCVD